MPRVRPVREANELSKAWFDAYQPLIAIQRRTGVNIPVSLTREVQRTIDNAFRDGMEAATREIAGLPQAWEKS